MGQSDIAPFSTALLSSQVHHGSKSCSENASNGNEGPNLMQTLAGFIPMEVVNNSSPRHPRFGDIVQSN